MGIYQALHDYLRREGPDRRRLKFTDIERVLALPLPASARLYQGWWANEAGPGRQSQAWLDAGWRTEAIDLAAEEVTFARHREAPAAPVGAAAGDAPVELALAFRWTALGRVVADAAGLPVFPTAPAAPGVYRLRLSDGGSARSYVGEAADLKRRFQHDRTPGADQQTNLRLGGLMRDHLAAGGTIDVDVVTAGDATVTVAGAPRPADLADSAVRRLLEHAARVTGAAIDIEELNR